MILEAEVTGKYDHEGDANALVYSPLTSPHSYHATRRYVLEFDGDEAAVRRFVERTLVEEVSQQVHYGPEPVLTGFSFILDYGFKPGALDLERETILNFHRASANSGFTLHKLTLAKRLYIFTKGTPAPPERFVRDIVNPAIHRHQIIPE